MRKKVQHFFNKTTFTQMQINVGMHVFLSVVGFGTIQATVGPLIISISAAISRQIWTKLAFLFYCTDPGPFITCCWI